MGNGMASASDDAARYRSGYPGQIDPPLAEARQNLDFYTGALRSRPDNALISEFHAPRAEGGWFGAYDELEMRHGYIQWLFPIREPGMNSEAQPLTTFEAEAIRADPDAVARVRRSLALFSTSASRSRTATTTPRPRLSRAAALGGGVGAPRLELPQLFAHHARHQIGRGSGSAFQEAIVAHFAEEVYEKGRPKLRALAAHVLVSRRARRDARARLSALAARAAEDADGDAGDEDDASGAPCRLCRRPIWALATSRRAGQSGPWIRSRASYSPA